jgi:CRP-like cAMP-binding protein
MSSVMPNGKSFMDLVAPGTVVGAAATISGFSHSFRLAALEECEFDRVEAPHFLTYLENQPYAALELLRLLCRQEVKLLRQMLHLMTRTPSSKRLLSALQDFGTICGEPVELGVRFKLPLTVQMLAEKIGCSRQWASKILGELEAAGKLKRNRSWITLLNGTDQ